MLIPADPTYHQGHCLPLQDPSIQAAIAEANVLLTEMEGVKV